MSRLSEQAGSEFRLELYRKIAKDIDLEIKGLSDISQIKINSFLKKPPPEFDRDMNKDRNKPPPNFGGRLGGERPPPPRGNFEGERAGERLPPEEMAFYKMWIVNIEGKVLFSKSKEMLPEEWISSEKPSGEYEVIKDSDFLGFNEDLYTVKLNSKKSLFLVLVPQRRGLPKETVVTIFILIFISVVSAFIFSIFFISIYLKNKSNEARIVLKKLEQGQLDERFTVKRFDEFSGLVGDFNTMADSIENLVSKVKSAEGAKKKLLQELGHDLRTPLTSLQSCLETLQDHSLDIKEDMREELFSIARTEVNYLKDLIDNLISISLFEVPHYKKDAKDVDLIYLVKTEISRLNSLGTNKIEWSLNTEEKKVCIRGDEHLILRMFKNAFENSGRYSKRKVLVKIRVVNYVVSVGVEDDGEGFSENDLSLYGTRRARRGIKTENGRVVSLGLGSVIMKEISNLYNGEIIAENIINEKGVIQGARVIIKLPVS